MVGAALRWLAAGMTVADLQSFSTLLDDQRCKIVPGVVLHATLLSRV